jgi:hydroxymethylglutaryl-CoA lyase
VPTEDVVYMLERSGYHTGLRVSDLIAAAQWLTAQMSRELPGMLSRAGDFPPPATPPPATPPVATPLVAMPPANAP